MRTLLPLMIIAVAACARVGPEVSVQTAGHAAARVVVMCRAVATKESGPPETVKTFGETYAFDPAVFDIKRNEPTEVVFWNLQGDDEHDFMLLDTHNRVVTQFKLPPLSKTSRIFTFRRAGLYRFYCTVHQPEMSGQITVLEP
jgi:plastocyanin